MSATAEVEQLKQLIKVTWDGDLISKDARDHLVRGDLVARGNGYNFITAKGIEYLVNLKILVP